MRLATTLCLLASIGSSAAAARWSRRQASTDTCTCPSTAPATSACVDYTMVTSSTTVTAFGGVVTSTASDAASTITISNLSTVTVTTGTTTLTLAGSTTISTDTTSTETTTRTITYYTSCSQIAYKHKRQASATTSVSQPTLTASSRSDVTFTFTSNVVQSGTVRPVTCTCSPKPTTATTLAGASSCNCPASTEVTVRLSSRVTATNFVFFTTTSYATVLSEPVVTVTSDVTITQSAQETIYTTLDFVEVLRPVTTVTSIVSTTVLSCPTPAQCNNQGIQWAAYNNTNAQGRNNANTNPNAGTDNTYSSFDPTVFKTRTPVYVGNVSTIGGFNEPQVSAQQIRIYNSPVTFTQNYLAIDHVGYLYAATSGTYKFTLAQADDLTLLWTGANARTGWTRANAHLVDYYNKANAVYSFDLFQGNYIPFRIFYANAQGASQFEASVTAPDGTVILNSNSKASPYLVQYSCNSGVAPPFPPFGAES